MRLRILILILLFVRLECYSQSQTELTSSVALYNNAIDQLYKHLSTRFKIDTFLVELRNIGQEKKIINSHGLFTNEGFIFKPNKAYDVYVLRPIELKNADVQVFFTYYTVRKKKKMKYYVNISDYKLVYEYDCQNKYWNFVKIEEIGF